MIRSDAVGGCGTVVCVLHTYDDDDVTKKAYELRREIRVVWKFRTYVLRRYPHVFVAAPECDN